MENPGFSHRALSGHCPGTVRALSGHCPGNVEIRQVGQEVTSQVRARHGPVANVMSTCKMFCFRGRSSLVCLGTNKGKGCSAFSCHVVWLCDLLEALATVSCDSSRYPWPIAVESSIRNEPGSSDSHLLLMDHVRRNNASLITPSLLRSGVKRFAVRHNGNAFSKWVVHSNSVPEPTVDGQNLASSN